MKIVISKNDSFGQLYLDNSEGNSIRIPTDRVALFRQAVGLYGTDIVVSGPDAERVWAIAQQFSEEEEEEEEDWFVGCDIDRW